VNAPWAPPGNYTVRLTANGKTHTQPIVVKLDPRVRTPAAGLAQLAQLTRSLYDGAVADHDALLSARALSEKLASVSGADAAAFKARVDSLAPPEAAGGRGRGGRGGGGGGRGGRGGGAAAGPPTLESASTAMMAADMAMQNADITPTASEVEAATKARTESSAAMARWHALSTTELAALNGKLKASGQPAVTVPK
jgi:hypothetical protein